jgi:hypothetical protein
MRGHAQEVHSGILEYSPSLWGNLRISEKPFLDKCDVLVCVEKTIPYELGTGLHAIGTESNGTGLHADDGSGFGSSD